MCTNGHVINDSAGSNPVRNAAFCGQCGRPSITACPACDRPIKGEYNVPGIVAIGFVYHPPAYCDSCGKAYPWTQSRLEAARELAGEVDGLADDERRTLERTFDDLVSDTARTPVAVSRFRRLVAKAGPQAGNMFRELLVNVVTEATRQALWPK